MSRIKQGHVDAGGVRYGYEIHGEGAPLLLRQRVLGMMDMFAPVRGRLVERRQVIAATSTAPAAPCSPTVRSIS